MLYLGKKVTCIVELQSPKFLRILRDLTDIYCRSSDPLVQEEEFKVYSRNLKITETGQNIYTHITSDNVLIYKLLQVHVRNKGNQSLIRKNGSAEAFTNLKKKSKSVSWCRVSPLGTAVPDCTQKRSNLHCNLPDAQIH